MIKSKSWGGKIAVVLCSVLLGTQTGCIPGKHGGPPGLPPLPGVPRAEQPVRAPAVTTTGENLQRISGLFARNEQPANATTPQGQSYE